MLQLLNFASHGLCDFTTLHFSSFPYRYLTPPFKEIEEQLSKFEVKTAGKTEDKVLLVAKQSALEQLTLKLVLFFYVHEC